MSGFGEVSMMVGSGIPLGPDGPTMAARRATIITSAPLKIASLAIGVGKKVVPHLPRFPFRM